MSLSPGKAQLLRIYIGENDQHQSRPVYEAIVMTAREMGLAGATVLRGPLGFGHSSHLHTAKILRLSQDLPMVIEIVDSEERIKALLDAIDPMIAAASALVTLAAVEVLQYGPRQAD
jgi:PII-like signaling protein